MKRKAQNAAESILSLDDLLPASVTGVPVKGSEARKKRTGRVKGRSKVTDEAEDEIPQLVPIADTPAKENSEVFLLLFNTHTEWLSGHWVADRHYTE